jgi:radical SAM protein with 4Fe4S-binding SPASM domain
MNFVEHSQMADDNASIAGGKPAAVRERQPFLGGVGLSLGPDGTSGDWQIGIDTAIGFLNRVGEFLRGDAAPALLGLPYPTRLQIAGCEPFSAPDDLDNLLTAALANGMRAEVTTHISWVESYDHALALLTRFKDKIHPLSVFVTQRHIETYGLSALANLAEAVRSLRMNININCGMIPGSPFPKAILSLAALNSHTTVIRSFPVFSQAELSDPSPSIARFLLPEPPIRRRCSDAMGLLISPQGEVYPCSRGFGLESLRLGNLNTDSVEDMVRFAISSRFLRKLHREGPYFLYQACKSSPAGCFLRDGYIDPCDFHRHATTEPHLRAVVSDAELQLESESQRHALVAQPLVSVRPR